MEKKLQSVDKRQQLLDLLAAYSPTAPEEITYKNEIIMFVKAHEDCFERTLEVGHITASAWLLSKDHAKALLLHHKKLNNWFQLGGHCDGDSDTLAVAIKEAQEESGMYGIEPVALTPTIFDIDVHLIPERKHEKAHFHYDIRFLLQVTTDEHVIQNEESNELRWIDKNKESLPTTSRSVARMFEKWLASQNI